MVFPKYRAVIFINGCFWHNHDCRFSKLPATRRKWWKKKLEENRRRDAAALSALSEMDWRALVIWECSFRVPNADRPLALERVTRLAARFLCSNQRNFEIRGTYPGTHPRNNEETE